jgi:hypothetical protein
VARDQLRRHLAGVGDGDRVGEAVDALSRGGLLGQEPGFDLDANWYLAMRTCYPARDLRKSGMSKTYRIAPSILSADFAGSATS